MRAANPHSERRILGLTLRDHIGGRWAISLVGFLILAPFTLITLASDITAVPVDNQWLQWLVASIASYLSFGGIYLIANFTLFRNRAINPVPIAWVATLGSVASVVRAEVNSYLTYQFGLIPDYLTDISLRLVTNILFGAVLWTLIPLTFSLVSSFRQQRLMLMIQAAELRGEGMQTSGESKVLEDALRRSIAGEFQEVITARDSLAARSMSHRIWESAEPEKVPHLRLSSLIVRTLTRNPYAVVPVIAIWGFSTWGSSAQALGAGNATLRMSICFLTIFLAFRAGRNISQRYTRHPLVIFTLVMTVVLAVVGPITSVIFDPDPASATAVTIANCIWLLSIVLTVSCVKNSLTYSEEILADLQQDLLESEVELLAAQNEERRIRMELATLLHGSVQSRLLTAAALLSQNPSNTPNPEVEAALVNVAGLLFDSPVEDLGLRSGMELAAEPWRVLMDISISIGPEVSDTVESVPLVHIAQEALANAFRHGSASSVRITINGDARHATMTVVDNGAFDPRRSQPGLGSALLDSLASGRWELTQSEQGGGCLTVTTLET